MRPLPVSGTLVWRILRRRYAGAPFDGEGAFRYGGRWSSTGTRLAYSSEHLSLAMLEYFVHMDRSNAPGDLAVVSAEVPSTVSRSSLALGELPANWRSTPAPSTLAALGDAFVRSQNSCVLIVPSAINPRESNWLINPAHPDFVRVQVREIEPFDYDPRLLVS